MPPQPKKMGGPYFRSRVKFLKAGYRALGADYEHDGFVDDMVTHGPEISLGVIF